MKKNYKPKANDKGKENGMIFETWPISKKLKTKYRHATHHVP